MKKIIFCCLLLLVMASAFTGLTRTISGTITDDAGNPIIAHILIKETKKGVSTTKNGTFSIEINDDNAVLVVSSVGYESKEVIVGKQDKLVIKLSMSTGALAEVVATGGYAAQRKSAMVRSMSVGGNVLGSSPGVRIGGNLSKTYGYSEYTNQPRDKNKDFKRFFDSKMNTEGYDRIIENPFLTVQSNPLSTFSIDVDAASYSNVRRFLTNGQLPPDGAVRIEEMINYFSYEYAQPTGKDPFAVHTELAVCPWNKDHQIAMIGLQGKKIDASKLPPSNLTFLIDVSGSMMSDNKLPLVKSSLKLLVDQLRPQDNVSIVVYAGNAGLVLPSTEGDRKIAIKEAIDRLEAGGSTAGGDGIRLAYKEAKKNFNSNGNNRVILCTDGDFNVGEASDDAMERLIEGERKTGVYLTVLGYGMGNYQDAKMQKLADKGNGNHAYIDDISEAKKVLINEFGETLFAIAKDVKLQIEFNPEKVKGYRLIGYENRLLAKEDFNNDKKDAGELGSGHTVTAIYEIIPVGISMPENEKVDSLRYQVMLSAVTTTQKENFSGELMNIKLRYKEPDSDVSKLLSHPVKDKAVAIENASTNFRFATAVASFGMLLRHSQYKGNTTFNYVRSLAADAKGNDIEGYRREFLKLVEMAAKISRKDVAVIE